MSVFGKHKKRNVRRSSDQDYEAATLYRGETTDVELEQPKPKHKRWKWLLISLGILTLLAAIAAAVAYFYIDTTVLKGEREGRVNILVLGVDDAAKLSDTIMMVSLDMRHGEQLKAAMVSVPRDFYVPIPGYGSQKINAAYSYGQNYHYPGGGPALTSKTLTEVSGQQVHYYVALDFSGFRKMIDAVGGIDVNVKEAIDDPYYPTYRAGYTHFVITKGQHHLDGEMALRYARSRKTTTDFDRAARQQQIILALRDKIMSKDTLLSSERRNKLQRILDKHLKTNLSFREEAKLAELWRRIPDNRITRHVIDSSNLLTAYPGFGYALAPRAGIDNFSEIKTFFAQIFSKTKNTLPTKQQ